MIGCDDIEPCNDDCESDPCDNLSVAKGDKGDKGDSGTSTIDNTLYIDLEFGNDSTALRQRWDKPFLTYSAAYAAAQAGDTIVWRPGAYTIAGTVIFEKLGVSYHFELGAVVTGALYFRDLGIGPTTVNVTGFGEFISGAIIVREGSTINFNANKVTNFAFVSDTGAGNMNVNVLSDSTGTIHLRNTTVAGDNFANFRIPKFTSTPNNLINGYNVCIYVGRRVATSRLNVNFYGELVCAAIADTAANNQYSQIVWGDNDLSGGVDDLTEVNIWGNCYRNHTTSKQGAFYLGYGDTLNVYGDVVDLGDIGNGTEACVIGTYLGNQAWGTATFYGKVTGVNTVVGAIEGSEYNYHFTQDITTSKAGRAVIDARCTLGLGTVRVDGQVIHTDAGNALSHAVFLRTNISAPVLVKFSQTAKVKIANTAIDAIAWDNVTPGDAIIESYPGCTSNEPIESGVVETISNMFIEGTTPASGTKISFTNGVISSEAEASVAGLLIETTDAGTGSVSQINSTPTNTEMSYNDGGTVVAASNADATQYEHSWTNGANGGSETVDATKHEITHTVKIIMDSPLESKPSLQVGNAGLVSGDLYFDTAANALLNGDLILIRKT